MKIADIVAIYKGKGYKKYISNERGIFIVSTFRSILMKLLYINKIETIEKHMADTNFAIKTHVGIIQRTQVKKTVMQGDIWAPSFV